MQDSSYFDLPALLPQDAYYDDIKQEACDDKAYAIVKEVVERFNLVTQEEYCDLYLYSDVLMQTDCMIGMRKSWREENDLDLFQSVTLPSAAFQAMWKQTGMVYPLITKENGGMKLMNELTEVCKEASRSFSNLRPLRTIRWFFRQCATCLNVQLFTSMSGSVASCQRE